MSEHFERVKEYLREMHLDIVHEDLEQELVVVDDEGSAINNLIVDCELPLVIIEQHIMEVPKTNREQFFLRLLQMSRTVVHGAFVLDEEGRNVLFRNTLQLETLQFNELESSIRALDLALAEHGDELIRFSKEG